MTEEHKQLVKRLRAWNGPCATRYKDELDAADTIEFLSHTAESASTKAALCDEALDAAVLLKSENDRLIEENNELRKTVSIMEANYSAIKRERDAAIADIYTALTGDPCVVCGKATPPANSCTTHDDCCFHADWRGVCAANVGKA